MSHGWDLLFYSLFKEGSSIPYHTQPAICTTLQHISETHSLTSSGIDFSTKHRLFLTISTAAAIEPEATQNALDH